MKICFTGHRPDKLGGYNRDSDKNLRIKEKIKNTVLEIIEPSYRGHEVTVIVGGALGTDQMAFDACHEIKWPLTIEIAIPFGQQHIKWTPKQQEYYLEQLKLANEITAVDYVEGYEVKGIDKDIYHPGKMDKRNRYMVDNADIVIAVWNGDEKSKSGTWNCIKYARKKGKKIIYIDPNNLESKEGIYL